MQNVYVLRLYKVHPYKANTVVVFLISFHYENEVCVLGGKQFGKKPWLRKQLDHDKPHEALGIAILHCMIFLH